MNGILRTLNGDLLRKGFEDFQNSPNFDSNIHTFVTDILEEHLVKTVDSPKFTRWNGSEYVFIDIVIKQIKERVKILGEVLSSVTSQAQLDRMLDALDTNASILASLDNYNYLLTSSRLAKAVTSTAILPEDKTLIESKFPAGWNT